MEDAAFAGILARSLALLDAGEDIDSIVARFPDAAGELEPLLRVASTLHAEAHEEPELAPGSFRRIGRLLQGQPPG